MIKLLLLFLLLNLPDKQIRIFISLIAYKALISLLVKSFRESTKETTNDSSVSFIS